jgi:hypothetical protein
LSLVVCLCPRRPLLGGLTICSAVLVTLSLFAAAFLLPIYLFEPAFLLALEGVIPALRLQME